MGIDNDISRLLSIRVDESEPPGSRFALPQFLRTRVANDDTLAARVMSNVVGVIRELYCSNGLKRGRVKYLRHSIQAASNEQVVRRGIVEDTLRLGEVGDGVDALPWLEINDFECMVFDCGHKESLASHVDAEMIDASLYMWKWDVRIKRQH